MAFVSLTLFSALEPSSVNTNRLEKQVGCVSLEESFESSGETPHLTLLDNFSSISNGLCKVGFIVQGTDNASVSLLQTAGCNARVVDDNSTRYVLISPVMDEFNIQLSINNVDSAKPLSIFGLRCDNGVFFSSSSFNHAYLIKTNWLYFNDFMNENDYSKAISSIATEKRGYPIAEDTDFVFPPHQTDVTISARVRWEEGNTSNVYPAAGLKATLFRINYGSSNYVPLGNCYLNNQGVFSFTVPQSSSSTAPSYYVRVYTECQYSRVAFCDYLTDNNPLYVEYGPFSPSVTLFPQTHVYPMDNIDGTPNLFARMVQISQMLYYGETYVFNMSNSHLSTVKALFPTDIGGCEYHRDDMTIYVDEEYYEEWDVVCHEMGHHVQHELGFHADHSSSTSTHSSYVNNIARYGKLDGLNLTWDESWPTVFAELAQEYYSSQLNGIPNVADHYCTSSFQNISYSLENGESYSLVTGAPALNVQGEGLERCVIRLLYDLYDPYDANETFDTVSLGHQAFWDIFIDVQPLSLSYLFEHIYTISNIDKNALGAICEEYGFAPSGIMAISTLVSWSAPCFKWNHCNIVGFSSPEVYYKSNYFLLEFYDEQKNLIVSDYVTDTSEYLYTEYWLTSSLWSQVIANAGDVFYVRIGSYQTTWIATGPYWSQYVGFNCPSV